MGSHCGVSIGEDGPSQMALEDLSMFQSLPGCTVFYPTDAVAMERAVELAANTRGITFLRASRPALPVIYGNDEQFQIGKAKIVRQSENDQVLVIGAGVTLYEAVLASLATVRNTVVKKLAVNSVPRSGPPAELLEMFGISASHIVSACNDIMKM